MKTKILAFTGVMAFLVVLACSREARGQQFESGGYFLDLSTLTVDSYGESDAPEDYSCSLYLYAHGSVTSTDADNYSEAEITNIWLWTGVPGEAPSAQITTDLYGSGVLETSLSGGAETAVAQCNIEAHGSDGVGDVSYAQANAYAQTLTESNASADGTYGEATFSISYGDTYYTSTGTASITCRCYMKCEANTVAGGGSAYAYVSLDSGAYCTITLVY